MVLLAASIMCANQLELKEELISLEKAGIDILHCDVMDGVFVNNMAMGPYVLEQISNFTKIPLDIHLATVEPEKYIKLFLPVKPKYISFHIETTKDPLKIVELLKKNNIGVSVALSPKTELSEILPIIKFVDMVLIMTVNPGFAGQKFNYRVVEKLKKLNSICKDIGISPIIEVDGCINKSTIPDVVTNGANLLVLGTSALFKPYNDYSKTVKEIKSLIDKT
ncbi:ribulose-phosphate 3-epimerase [Caloramator sp. E03]|nr:ribulose-phosphate 3-epimerase [Caloramator sp. E03]